MLGVMLDCSRNAVMRPDKVKEFAAIIKKMGYDTLMLYTEDTYEVNNRPLFGYMRGRYTKEELKDIDSYCVGIGIELVPCIQTLAHLGGIFKWWDEFKAVNDCDDILLVGEEKTYELIDDMLSTISECFSSKKIHIGMDEAHRVGTGKYKDLHGERVRFDIINEHLHRVCGIADKYGMKPMIWSDMFCKLASGDGIYYDEYNDISKIREKAALPENVSLVYWNYYSNDKDRYLNRIKLNQAFGREVIFAGGAWAWKGFAPDNAMSIENTEPAVSACHDRGVDNILMTVWGDDGAECSYFSILPTLMYTAEMLKGNTDGMKERFFEIVGCDYDAFMLLDHLDTPGGRHDYNPSKYLFYNDIFCGLNDYRCDGTEDGYYKALAEKIKNIEDRGNFGYMFDMYETLAEVLSLKSDLGIRARKAYSSGNREEAAAVASDCAEAVTKLEKFHKAFEKCWFEEKKPYGFDIQDMRIGGVIQRIKSCGDRLLQFAKGEIGCIPELEEEIIDAKCEIHWSRMISPNVITHYL